MNEKIKLLNIFLIIWWIKDLANIAFPLNYNLNLIMKILIIMCSFYIILKLKLTKRELIIFATVTFITKLNTDFLYIFLIIFLLKGDKKRELIKKYFYYSLSQFIVVVLLWKLGYIPGGIYYRDAFLKSGLRYDLGFGNPNAAYKTLYLFYISFIYLYLKNKKVLKIIVLMLSYYIYILTDSRTGFLTIVISFLILPKILERISLKNKIIYFLWNNLFNIFILISIFLLKFQYTYLDKLLSYRITVWNNQILKYGLFNIIGNYGLNLNESFDNWYLYNISKNGVIIFSIYLIIFYYVLKNIKHNKRLVLITLFTMIYLIFEKLWIPPLIVILIQEVYSKNKFRRKYKKNDKIFSYNTTL